MFKILIFIIILLIIPHHLIEHKLHSLHLYSIKQNDFTIFNLDNHNIKDQIKQNLILPSIQNQVLKLLPPDFTFLDYSYEIKNSSLYTFHRDVTSSKKFQNLSHNSYTLIIYFNKGKHLSICPNSHKFNFIIPKPKTICGNAGQAILFNSDIAHAAAMDKTTERYCKQYKICHKDDIYKLKHLQKQHIQKNEKIRTFNFLDYYIRLMSHKYLPIFDIKIIGKYIERKQQSSFVSFISNLFKLNFYNQT